MAFQRRLSLLVLFLLLAFPVASASAQEVKPQNVSVGFGEADITPKLGVKPVYIAGFGMNRPATKIHDPLKARVVVLRDQIKKIALVSVDLVGLFLESVQKVRKELPGFDFVLVSSTHNHEGPDTLGLWGPNPFQSGVDPEYLQEVERQIVKAVKQAEQAAKLLSPRFGTVEAPELLHDGRKPEIKHATLATLSFEEANGKFAGLVVQFNCHPETLSSKNTEVSADYVTWTVEHLQKKFQCPVVYLTGTVGGLMTSLNVPVKDEKGNQLKDGTFEKTARYGELVGRAAAEAVGNSQRIILGPMSVHTRKIYLPIDNPLYIAGWQLGVLKRPAFLWKGSGSEAGPEAKKLDNKERYCIQTELGLLRLGQLEIAAIPGEIYPELVLGGVPDPAEAGADFPTAPIEATIYKQLKSPHRMLIGLANDEVGYIIPKRQWDSVAPFCYGLKKSQYGEVNSLGPETAPLLCAAFQELAK